MKYCIELIDSSSETANNGACAQEPESIDKEYSDTEYHERMTTLFKCAASSIETSGEADQGEQWRHVGQQRLGRFDRLQLPPTPGTYHHDDTKNQAGH